MRVKVSLLNSLIIIPIGEVEAEQEDQDDENVDHNNYKGIFFNNEEEKYSGIFKNLTFSHP